MVQTGSAPPADPAELTRLAIDLARQAGELAAAAPGGRLSVSTKSSATDVVTDADRAVEELLRTELAAARPDDSILGEEAGDGGRADARVRWLVDPIDGTVNFMLGLPQWAVSIAAAAGRRDGRRLRAQPGVGRAVLGHPRPRRLSR